MEDKAAFYLKLKNTLIETTKFPTEYLYKFIVPTNGEQESQVAAVFNGKDTKIDKKKSKTGKYISISVVLIINSADEVISYYKAMENIEGIISL